MQSFNPYKILALAFLLAAAFLVGWCSFREKNHPAPVTPARSEAERVKADTENQAAQARFSADSAFEQRILKAIDERLIDLENKAKRREEKSKQSASKYAAAPTLENCHHALEDCQHENQSKAAVIGTQTGKIGSLQRTVKADSSELNRYRMANHLLNDNLKRSNEQWQETTEELVKAKKPRRIGLGVQAGYGINDTKLSPYIGIGVSYNLIRF